MTSLILHNQSDAAQILGVSTKTLEAMRQRGDGPVFRKIGRRVLYLESDLAAFVDARAYTSTSDFSRKCAA